LIDPVAGARPIPYPSQQTPCLDIVSRQVVVARAVGLRGIGRPGRWS
jgi:hypothetical protein